MKILFLLKSNRYSGAENVVLNIMALLSNDETYYVSPDGPIRKFVEERGLNFYPLEKFNRSSLKRVVNEVKPDLIHANDFAASVLAANSHCGVPIISHLHNNPLWLKKPLDLRTIILAFSLKHISKVISVSNSIENEFFYTFLLRKKNIVLSNFVNAERVKKLSKSSLKNFNNDLLFIGRLTEQKDPLRFCKIVYEIKKDFPDTKAAIIGEGELLNDVKKSITDYHLEKNIQLFGFKNNPYAYIMNSKIVIMPSKFEGFGLVAVESLILGKPVICSGVGGLRDIIDSSCGSICLSDFDYKREIVKLLTSSDLYESKSFYAKKKAVEFTDSEKYIKELTRIYNLVLKG